MKGKFWECRSKRTQRLSTNVEFRVFSAERCARAIAVLDRAASRRQQVARCWHSSGGSESASSHTAAAVPSLPSRAPKFPSENYVFRKLCLNNVLNIMNCWLQSSELRIGYSEREKPNHFPHEHFTERRDSYRRPCRDFVTHSQYDHILCCEILSNIHQHRCERRRFWPTYWKSTNISSNIFKTHFLVTFSG